MLVVGVLVALSLLMTAPAGAVREVLLGGNAVRVRALLASRARLMQHAGQQQGSFPLLGPTAPSVDHDASSKAPAPVPWARNGNKLIRWVFLRAQSIISLEPQASA